MLLAAIIAIYLAIITYTMSGPLQTTRRVVLLVFFWLIGLIALALLVRGWRRSKSINVQ